MEKIKINQTEAIKLLREGKNISNYSIEFNGEKIEAIQAIELGKNNIDVPEHLIYYDDTTIDFSDDPDITKEDIETGKISWKVHKGQDDSRNGRINSKEEAKNKLKKWLK